MTREEMIDEGTSYVFSIMRRSIVIATLRREVGNVALWGGVYLGTIPLNPLNPSFLAPAIRAEFTRISNREATNGKAS